MIFVAINCFFIMFVDNFLYRKSTTCNDLNVRNDDYSCFDVKDPLPSFPGNCSDPVIKNY